MGWGLEFRVLVNVLAHFEAQGARNLWSGMCDKTADFSTLNTDEDG